MKTEINFDIKEVKKFLKWLNGQGDYGVKIVLSDSLVFIEIAYSYDHPSNKAESESVCITKGFDLDLDQNDPQDEESLEYIVSEIEKSYDQYASTGMPNVEKSKNPSKPVEQTDYVDMRVLRVDGEIILHILQEAMNSGKRFRKYSIDFTPWLRTKHEPYPWIAYDEDGTYLKEHDLKLSDALHPVWEIEDENSFQWDK